MLRFILGQIISSLLTLLSFALLLHFFENNALIINLLLTFLVSVILLGFSRLVIKSKTYHDGGEKFFAGFFNNAGIVFSAVCFTLLLMLIPNGSIPIAMVVAVLWLPASFDVSEEEFFSESKTRKTIAGTLAIIQSLAVWYGLFKIYNWLGY